MHDHEGERVRVHPCVKCGRGTRHHTIRWNVREQRHEREAICPACWAGQVDLFANERKSTTKG